MTTGIIIGFNGSWGSGLASLDIDTDEGVQIVNCDNGATVRALDAIFGDVITCDHGVNLSALCGREIAFEVDEFGLLAAIAPVEEAA